MNVQQHVQDSVPGVVGTTVAGGFTLVGFVQWTLPTLQALSLLVGIAVGVVTFLYYYKRVKAESLEAQAKVAAAAVEAQAKVTAAALDKK